MASGEVKLLGTRQSPFVLRAHIALKIKSVKYEFLEEDLRSKSHLLLKSNPVEKKVPVLIHGNVPISESLVILEYIDEAWPSGPGILPSDPQARALARFWASFIDQKWFPSVRGILRSEGEERKKKIEEAFEGAALMESAFVSISKKQKFFGGESIGFLDIVMGSFLPWMKAVREMSGVEVIDAGRTPCLYKWAGDFCSDAAVKEYLPATEELVEFAKFLLAKFRAQAEKS